MERFHRVRACGGVLDRFPLESQQDRSVHMQMHVHDYFCLGIVCIFFLCTFRTLSLLVVCRLQKLFNRLVL